MILKLESDLHLEFWNHSPNLENIDVYIIAGDLAELKNCPKFILKLLEEYPKLNIVHVSGNHENYGTYIEKTDRILKELSNSYNRYHYLQNDSIVIKGIRFIGSTLWTSLNNSDPLGVYHVQNGLNDFRYIRCNNGKSRFTPSKFVSLHREAKKYIFKTIEESEEPTIVITHHCPHSLEHNKVSNLWHAFQEDLYEDINKLTKLPKYWLSGHRHQNDNIIIEYDNGSVNFISNCKGYPQEHVIDYDPNFTVDT